MKKFDLKNGMVVENREGNRFIIVNNLLIRDTGFYELSNLDAQLQDKDSDTKYDLVKVYDTITALKLIEDTSKLELLWERNWKPQEGDKYYTPAFSRSELYAEQFWDNDYYDANWYSRGLVFRTKEEAVKCAKKMVEFVKEEC